jgi:GNAT superfamily N-acetyltransferase
MEFEITPATLEDLDPLADLLFDLFSTESDFDPDRAKQVRGLRLIIENPNRGRIFVMRSHGRLIGMVNLLITISTAEGGFVLLLEDLIMAKEFRGLGLGTKLLDYAVEFAREKRFHRITLLTDPKNPVINFYLKNGFHKSGMTPMRMGIELESDDVETL